jgi:hypothetical protein
VRREDARREGARTERARRRAQREEEQNSGERMQRGLRDEQRRRARTEELLLHAQRDPSERDPVSRDRLAKAARDQLGPRERRIEQWVLDHDRAVVVIEIGVIAHARVDEGHEKRETCGDRDRTPHAGKLAAHPSRR